VNAPFLVRLRNLDGLQDSFRKSGRSIPSAGSGPAEGEEPDLAGLGGPGERQLCLLVENRMRALQEEGQRPAHDVGLGQELAPPREDGPGHFQGNLASKSLQATRCDQDFRLLESPHTLIVSGPIASAPP
jgi:hypothetical protein